jgi:hypothetical protein
MRNTADVTGGKLIAVLLQSISGVSAIKSFSRLLRHPWKKEIGAILLFCPGTTRDTLQYTIVKLYCNSKKLAGAKSLRVNCL